MRLKLQGGAHQLQVWWAIVRYSDGTGSKLLNSEKQATLGSLLPRAHPTMLTTRIQVEARIVKSSVPEYIK